jgi:hypothetical protein
MQKQRQLPERVVSDALRASLTGHDMILFFCYFVFPVLVHLDNCIEESGLEALLL